MFSLHDRLMTSTWQMILNGLVKDGIRRVRQSIETPPFSVIGECISFNNPILPRGVLQKYRRVLKQGKCNVIMICIRYCVVILQKQSRTLASGGHRRRHRGGTVQSRRLSGGSQRSGRHGRPWTVHVPSCGGGGGAESVRASLQADHSRSPHGGDGSRGRGEGQGGGREAGAGDSFLSTCI